jgi:hypothetical protein
MMGLLTGGTLLFWQGGGWSRKLKIKYQKAKRQIKIQNAFLLEGRVGGRRGVIP